MLYKVHFAKCMQQYNAQVNVIGGGGNPRHSDGKNFHQGILTWSYWPWGILYIECFIKNGHGPWRTQDLISTVFCIRIPRLFPSSPLGHQIDWCMTSEQRGWSHDISFAVTWLHGCDMVSPWLSHILVVLTLHRYHSVITYSVTWLLCGCHMASWLSHDFSVAVTWLLGGHMTSPFMSQCMSQCVSRCMIQ